MIVKVVTAKRFNSIFKQIVGFRKHNDLRRLAIYQSIFFEPGVGLRETNTWLYPIEVCIFVLCRRLQYDNRVFKLGESFYKLHIEWLIRELEPHLFDTRVNDRQYNTLLKYISQHSEDIWTYMEQSKNGQYLVQFYKTLEELQKET